MAKFSLQTINSTCYKCNGKCWNPTDNAATQKAVAEKFGFPIPNDCVTNNGGKEIRCPKALGLI